MKTTLLGSLFLLALILNLLTPAPVHAFQYPVLDPAYTQEIYAGPVIGAGMAWTSSLHLLARNGSNVMEYYPTQTTTYLGTSLHGIITTHSVTGLDPGGAGMTNGLNGYLYANSPAGLQRIDPSNWGAAAVTIPGTVGGMYGIATLPDGRIAYNDSAFGASKIYVYDPVANTNTLCYSTNTQLDGIVSGPGGNLALADQTGANIIVISVSLSGVGAYVNSFSTGVHFPDGLAFSETVASSTLYSNNNDGTISRYVLGPGYTGTPTTTLIASGSGAYGDLAAVGPDCAFYVTQSNNGGYHGSTNGVGTHWDLPITNGDPSIIRIGGAPSIGSDGLPGDAPCMFYSPLEGYLTPEPASLALLLGGLLPLLQRRRATRGA